MFKQLIKKLKIHQLTGFFVYVKLNKLIFLVSWIKKQQTSKDTDLSTFWCKENTKYFNQFVMGFKHFTMSQAKIVWKITHIKLKVRDDWVPSDKIGAYIHWLIFIKLNF